MLRKKMIRDIKQNLSQFITIFLMVFIGVMAYSGIESYMEGMKQTANNFYTQNNLQDLNVMGALSKENVELVKDVVKNGNDSKEAIKAVGLEEHMNKFPNQLSGGEQQRVSIARAIAKNPKLLLCDEPTGALDSKTGVEVLKLLKKQCEGNKGANTVIIVTHNSLFAEIADTVIRVKNGKIESVTPNENPKKIDEVKW